MKKYRIKKIEYQNEEVYIVEKRFILFCWKELEVFDTYANAVSMIEAIKGGEVKMTVVSYF